MMKHWGRAFVLEMEVMDDEPVERDVLRFIPCRYHVRETWRDVILVAVVEKEVAWHEAAAIIVSLLRRLYCLSAPKEGKT